MPLPKSIPAGARLMVRTFDGHDEKTGRQQYRDFIGHVRSWDGHTLCITRDAAANGSRPAYDVDILRDTILALKPIPERKRPMEAKSESAVRQDAQAPSK